MKMRFAMIGTALLAALSVTVCAATADEAKSIAEKYVPAGSAHIKTEIDDGNYEVTFYQKDTGIRYEVAVSQASDKIVAFDSQKDSHKGGRAVVISKEAAEKAVSGEHKDAEILYTILDKDDGFSKYKVSFRTEVCYGEYDIHPETGEILERDIYVGSMPTEESLNGGNGVSGDIGLEKARQIALGKAPAGAQVKKLELDYDDGRAVYEGELRHGRWEYEFKLDAAAGTVLEWEQDYDD